MHDVNALCNCNEAHHIAFGFDCMHWFLAVQMILMTISTKEVRKRRR